MEENEGSFDLMKWVKKNMSVLILSVLGIGGTGTGVGFGGPIYDALLQQVVNDLDSTHNIKPLPAHLDNRLSLMEDTERSQQKKTDSLLLLHGNFISYQKGFNLDIALNDNKVDTICDGIPMQYNTVNGTFHVEWDGYVYTATKVGKDTWAIFLFQWQIPIGASNYYEVDPMYWAF